MTGLSRQNTHIYEKARTRRLSYIEALPQALSNR